MGTSCAIAGIRMQRSDLIVNWKETLALMMRRRFRYNVVGSSMEPLLHKGEDVLVRSYTSTVQPQVSDIVVIEHPEIKAMYMIKQLVASDTATGMCQVRGINLEQSTDSRHFGDIPISHLTGKVTAILAKQ